MNPFIESMPSDWVIQAIGAQGVALCNVKKLADDPNADIATLTLNRAALYFGYFMYKSGLMTIEDQISLAVLETEGIQHPMMDRLPEAIGQSLKACYSAMDHLVADAFKEGKLVSNLTKTKTTLQ